MTKVLVLRGNAKFSYFHLLTNLLNCTEFVTALVVYIWGSTRKYFTIIFQQISFYTKNKNILEILSILIFIPFPKHLRSLQNRGGFMLTGSAPAKWRPKPSDTVYVPCRTVPYTRYNTCCSYTLLISREISVQSLFSL